MSYPNLSDLLDSVGINPDTSDAGVLSRPDQYGAALVVGYAMLEEDDE